MSDQPTPEARAFELGGEFIDHLVQHGWTFAGRTEDNHSIADIAGIDIPQEYLRFLNRFDLLASPGDDAWFLSSADYLGTSEGAFAWDEFRTMSLEAAMSDDDRRSVNAFWARHLPILLSVGGDYEFLAVDRVTGAIVAGGEPEFEETALVAPDLESFMRMVISGEVPLPGT